MLKNKLILSIFFIVVIIAAIIFIPQLLQNRQAEQTQSSEPQSAETAGEATKEDAAADQKNADTSKPAAKPLQTDNSKSTEEQAKELLKGMTLEEKVGQMMMIGIHGHTLNSEAEDMIRNKKIGGIIYFSRNMSTPGQVAELSNSLQKEALKERLRLPLMIALDQEGGAITRMKDKVSPLPSQQKIGQKAAPDAAYEVAKLNGTELRAMGVNINFAPVMDLSKTDSRSLGTDPMKAYLYGSKIIQGLQSQNITGALKHFPGNGRSSVDPHKDTSAVEANEADLEKSDIYPFTQMIKNTDNQNFFVMVTHIKYPAYDKEKPASLSPAIIQDLLRKKLGYKGIVVTDDLEMGAVNKYYSFKDMGVEAVNAGVDLLLVCHEYKHQEEIYNGVLEAVKSGKIKEQRINEAVTRILIHKLEKHDSTEADPQKADQIVGSQEHRELLKKLGF
ncbi:beta-N-acetylhexosaminidase [Metabacillus sp. GX 13764]|uniref:beta-N-acetylhexosaminidase n=1 Tax=Metabacillus kandeliae TaxID=2900151 RepID=UPI001E3482D0|nr:beta-N-acetylhexosaminidase [Metabacillus kandeliae]MCD7034624.1 beta-N-acetylhexosaminidase [Metabacillus kandeliae]